MMDTRNKLIEEAYNKQVWEPLQTHVQSLNMLLPKIGQRNMMRMDYDAAKSTLAAYQLKPPRADKMQAAQQKHAFAEQLYKMINDEVKSQMLHTINSAAGFWSTILAGVLAASSAASAETNKLVVPRIKELGAIMRDGSPVRDAGQGRTQQRQYSGRTDPYGRRHGRTQ